MTVHRSSSYIRQTAVRSRFDKKIIAELIARSNFIYVTQGAILIISKENNDGREKISVGS